MKDKIFSCLIDCWGDYKSIPFAFVFLFLVFISNVFKIEINSSFWFFSNARLAFGIFCIIVFLGYVLFCVLNNRLPCASNDKSVLFVVSTEDASLFRSVKYKLVDNFENFTSNIETTKFEALCVSLKKLKNYNINRKEDVTKILEKTNCMFLINVRYDVDEPNNAENFEMTINLEVLRRDLNGQYAKILENDLRDLGKLVKNKKFVKSNKLEIFNFTANALSFICKYILGLANLLSDNTVDAINSFEAIYKKLNTNETESEICSAFINLVPSRLYASYIFMTKKYIMNFRYDENIQHLKIAQEYLDKANAIFPETYDYNLNTAYIAIMLYRDLRHAKMCIEKCKYNNKDHLWKYSDAFLSAYQGYEPSTIISKYESAFAQENSELINLAAYTEIVLNNEPDRISLHLAAGLLYEKLGDTRLKKKHISTYLAHSKRVNMKMRNRLENRMLVSSCGVSCGHNCHVCSEQNFG